MFLGPEYESYIALCRKLRLERRAQELDVYVNTWDTGHEVEFVRSIQQAALMRLPDVTEAGNGSFWLPRLDQWLDIIQVSDHPRSGWLHVAVELHRPHDGLNSSDSPLWEASTLTASGGALWRGVAPTREEACARLWAAVTG